MLTQVFFALTSGVEFRTYYLSIFVVTSYTISYLFTFLHQAIIISSADLCCQPDGSHELYDVFQDIRVRLILVLLLFVFFCFGPI